MASAYFICLYEDALQIKFYSVHLFYKREFTVYKYVYGWDKHVEGIQLNWMYVYGNDEIEITTSVRCL